MTLRGEIQMLAVRTHYLDTSAIIKLFLDEADCQIIREYYNKQTTFYTTSLCFAETLGKLKDMRFHRKQPNNISESQYLAACNALLADISSGAIGIDEIAINNREVYKNVENITQKYSLDVADAFQIYTLKEGYFSRLRGESSPLLITADDALAEAARKEGLKAWNFRTEPTP
jgi:predicted nucleic acid-binding protein